MFRVIVARATTHAAHNRAGAEKCGKQRLKARGNMSSGFFRGTNTEQDSRWGDAEKKLLRRTKFSKVLEQKVNMKKVNMDVMQRWITQRITSLLGFEDDIVVGTCVNYLSEEGKLDPKKLQLQLTGFLEKSTSTFMEELWGLLVDAQNSLGGIPSAFLQDKKQEMLQAKEEQRRQEEELHRRLTEHQQEMERSKLSADGVAADGGSSSSVLEQLPRQTTREGRRASRWGKPDATRSASSNEAPILSTSMDGAVENTTEVQGGSTSGVLASPADVAGPGDAPRNDETEEAHHRREKSADRSESVESMRKLSGSQREDTDEDVPKGRKRKSKSKHKKKSDRKKSKSRHRDGEGRERRRSTKNNEQETSVAMKSSDEASSTDDDDEDAEVKDGVDVEEALRLKALAAMAVKKSQREQGDT